MDADSRTVLQDDREVMEYDVLSINIGPQPHREAVERAMPGAREHGLFAPPLESFVSLGPKVCEMGRSRALRIAARLVAGVLRLGGPPPGVEAKRPPLSRT
jgi:NADH dehydrogenase FAD-containing subunit